MKSSWDDFWRGYNVKTLDSWSKRRMKQILSVYARPGINVLDAGCGSGFFSAFFLSCGCDVYSMDYSDVALSIAKEITGHKSRMYIKGNILDEKTLLDMDGRFDIIFLDGLMEHYSRDEQDRIVKIMKRLKKGNGYIINFVPNRFSFWSLVRPFLMHIKERPFVMGDFLDLHKRNDLRIVESGGINVLPFRISPERLLGRYAGMLFYCVAR